MTYYSRRKHSDALRRALAVFNLPQQYKHKTIGERMEITNTETGKKVLIERPHFTSVAAAIVAFMPEQQAASKTETPPFASEPVKEDPLKAWKESLPGSVPLGEDILLEKCTVAVESKRPDTVIGSAEEHPDARHELAYAISLKGRHEGYMLVFNDKKCVLVIPTLVPEPSTHRGFDPALMRLEFLFQHPATPQAA